MASPSTFPVSDGITQVTALSLVLVALFVPGRLVSNLRMQRRLFVDDYVTVAGTVLFIAYTGLCFGLDAYARYHESAGTWDPTAPYFLKVVYAAEVLASPASLTAKASILLLYLRIFNPSIGLRRWVVIVAGIAGVFAVPSLPLFSFFCAPNATISTWEPSIALTCATINPWTALLQVADMVINLIIFILPLPSIFRLHLSMKRRLLLAFVLMHGIFALTASVVGAVYRVKLAKTPAEDLDTALWFRTAAFTAFGVELSMTLVTGSMHACWGYLRSAHTQYRSSKGSKGAAAYYYDSERNGASSRSGDKMATPASVVEGGSMTPPELAPAQQTNGFQASRTTRQAPHRWGVAFASHSRTQALPEPDEEDELHHTRPSTAPAAAVPPESMTKFPPSSSESGSSHTDHSSDTYVYPAGAPAAFAPSAATSSTPATAPATLELQPQPQPHRLGPHSRSSNGNGNGNGNGSRLIADIEAAVAAAGRARLVVDHTRSSTGAGCDQVHVRQSMDLQRASTGPADPSREYVVERSGRDYIVSKAGQQERPREDAWMGNIRRDVTVEVTESL